MNFVLFVVKFRLSQSNQPKNPKATIYHDHCNHPRDTAGDHQDGSGDSGVPAPRPGLQRGPHWCRMRFKVIISNVEDGWLVVECLSLPGCISQGRTIEEVLENEDGH